jgi:hypothetical protein
LLLISLPLCFFSSSFGFLIVEVYDCHLSWLFSGFAWFCLCNYDVFLRVLIG